MTTSLRLKNDKRLRDKLYTPESYQIDQLHYETVLAFRGST